MGPIEGTTFKIGISITEGLGTLTMDDVDFYAEFYCYPNRKVKVTKAEMVRDSESSYIAVVDSSHIGPGNVMMTLYADIPDNDCPDGVRHEVYSTSTGCVLSRK